jgi:hypothetical protein
MEQKTLNQIVDHCERCERCAALAKALIDAQGSFGLDVDGFTALDESIQNCPNR